MRAKSQLLEKISQMRTEILEDPVNVSSQSEILVSLQEAVDSLDTKISSVCAEKNMKTIKGHYEAVTDLSGVFNIPKM